MTSRQDWLIGAFAASMIVVIFFLRISIDLAPAFQSLPLIIPIALVAMVFGRRGGLITAAACGLVIVASAFLGGPDFDPVSFVIPATCFAVIALIIGDLSTHRRLSAEENSRWFELSNDLLVTATLDGWFVRVNPAWERHLGYTSEEMMSRPFAEFIHPDDREPTGTVNREMMGGGEVLDFENRYLAKDGEWHWILWSALSEGELIYGVGKDITERKALEVESERLLTLAEGIARTDPLTGLANRRAWDEEFRREVERTRRRGSALAMLMIDLDSFKGLNDTEGHQAGDALLKELSLKWRLALRTGDIASRYGGDEFALLLPDCPPNFAENLFARLQRATPPDTPWSAGIAYWDGEETPETMAGRADEALYAAKARGGNQAVTAALDGIRNGRET